MPVLRSPCPPPKRDASFSPPTPPAPPTDIRSIHCAATVVRHNSCTPSTSPCLFTSSRIGPAPRLFSCWTARRRGCSWSTSPSRCRREMAMQESTPILRRGRVRGARGEARGRLLGVTAEHRAKKVRKRRGGGGWGMGVVGGGEYQLISNQMVPYA